MTTKEMLERAKAAAADMLVADKCVIDSALLSAADALASGYEKILAANAADVERARGVISDVMIDRLLLTKERIFAMAEGIRKIATLPSPVGEVLEERQLENGLKLQRVCVPLGVLAVIYESRPNVTADAAALALKSGNTVILRSGKEAHESAYAITKIIREAIAGAGLPKDAVLLVEDTTRASAVELMEARGYIDMLIPRGGAGLIRACVEGAKVPCLETGTGICHIYVDRAASLDMAEKIVYNAKTSRPSVCNAAEVLLVHEAVAKELLPRLRRVLVDERKNRGETPVELILDSRAAKYIDGTPATADSFDTEFLDYKLAVGIVGGVEEAVEHIAKHSTHHSEAIITSDEAAKSYFTKRVDSAAVYVNASTRFTDGGEFGLGCEMGIATQKMHARVPVGIRERRASADNVTDLVLCLYRLNDVIEHIGVGIEHSVRAAHCHHIDGILYREQRVIIIIVGNSVGRMENVIGCSVISVRVDAYVIAAALNEEIGKIVCIFLAREGREYFVNFRGGVHIDAY